MTMYLDHFGLREAPFKITPHTEFFFAGSNRGETLEALIYAITAGEGMVKVTGEVGSGKTMLCRVLMERLPDSVETIYLAVPSLSRDEMIAVIAGDLGIETQGANTTKLVRALQERLIELHAGGRQVVALIDEAHAMPLETLEEIRLLSNLETNQDKLMQIVLFGQPELDAHLMLPNMRQLKERITHAFTLLPLPPRDIRDYLTFRLRAAGYKGPDLFGPDALKLIADASEGLTRRINIYADKTLLAAFAGGTHTITADHVRAAISDTQIVVPRRSAKRKIAAAAAVGAAAGLVIGFIAGRASTPDASSSGSVAATTLAASPLHAVPPATATLASAETRKPVEAAPARTAEMAAHDSGTAKIAGAPAAPAGAQDWLAARLDADRSRLGAFAADRWGIQLMTADRRERPAIETYLADVKRSLDSDELVLYPTGPADAPRVGVLYGNFASRAEAQGALVRLPARISQFRPYVRSFRSLRDDTRDGTS